MADVTEMPKLCKDCLYYLGKMDGIYGRCGAPQAKPLLNLETGVESPAFTSRDMQGENWCDVEARWFVARLEPAVAAE